MPSAGSTPQRKSSPLLIWSAPSPSEVALPNSVAKIARMSIDLPIGPWMRSPSSGWKAELIRLGRSRRKREEGERETHDRVDRPGVERPVEVGQRHGLLGRLLAARARRARRRRREVRDGLRDREEHQADAHAGAEHHRDPGHRPELRPVVVLAEPDVPEAAEGEDAREHQEDHRRQDEEPAEGGDNPAENVVGHRRDAVGVEHSPQHEGRRDRCRYAEDPWVDPAPGRSVGAPSPEDGDISAMGLGSTTCGDTGQAAVAPRARNKRGRPPRPPPLPFNERRV